MTKNKINIEICIISARGLSQKSALFKPQYFAVGWIDPDTKYCTKIDSSGSPNNATWKTKFSASVDHDPTDHTNSERMMMMVLTVEVYKREPIFLRERIHGVATVKLQEFVEKWYKFGGDNKTGREFEETASFQLRERNSGKPKGFVDVSVRIFSDESAGTAFNSDPVEGITYSESESESEQGTGITLAIEDGPVYTYPYPSASSVRDPHRIPKQRPAHDQPPVPFHTGTSTTAPPYQYSSPADHELVPADGSRPGLGMGLGLGAGALAAGAMIFGDDFMSAGTGSTNFPSGINDDAASTVVVSTHHSVF